MVRGLKSVGTSVLYARIPTALYDAVQRIAADAGMTIAQTASRLIELGLRLPPTAETFERALEAERSRKDNGNVDTG